jgi:methylenetetrahydrofolate dehydrogenase (NADP+) / methenyltetrahydrofolate cyclohydrolase
MVKTRVIDGKQLAQRRRANIAIQIETLTSQGITPGLAVVLVGDDPASQVYVRNKGKACVGCGITHFDHTLPVDTSESALLAVIDSLNADDRVHGILVQLPLPAHIDTQRVIAAVSPAKDVDGFHPENVGRLLLGLPGPRPCTPLGIMAMLEASQIALGSAHAVVIGRSDIVGKPMAALLLEAHATVTICHSRTADVAAHVRQADLVVAAVGRPKFVDGSWIKPGATVIDVGINRLPDGSLCGDVDYAAAIKHAGAITPVPGGVGPMTIAMLMQNVVDLAMHQQRL